MMKAIFSLAIGQLLIGASAFAAVVPSSRWDGKYEGVSAANRPCTVEISANSYQYSVTINSIFFLFANYDRVCEGDPIRNTQNAVVLRTNDNGELSKGVVQDVMNLDESGDLTSVVRTTASGFFSVNCEDLDSNPAWDACYQLKKQP